MADIVTGLMIGATLVNAAKNLWELTLKLDGNREEKQSYRYRGNLDLDKVRNQRLRFHRKGQEIQKLEPLR